MRENVLSVKTDELFEHEDEFVVEMLKELFKRNIDVDVNEVMEKTVVMGYIQTLKLLLKDERVDPSAYDNYAIRAASENGQKEVVELLQKAINKRG